MPDFKRGIKEFGNTITFIATALSMGWVIVIMGFLAWEIQVQKRSAIEFARTEAIGDYNKDLVYRRWATLHGGVYVPVTRKTPPNPYLVNVREREISTPSGRILTLVNPAYMTRQVHELAQEQYGIKGHITSLNLIRPQNEPDDWEKKALQTFETGKHEIYNVALIKGESYLRLMRPMFVEKGCLKCHGYQGYKVGDIRGGISVSVPMAPYNAIASNNITKSIIVHAVILFLGLAGLGGAFFSINKHNRERLFAEERLDLAVKAARDGIWDWDIKNKKEYFSPRWFEIIGYSVNDPDRPGDFESWSAGIHPDDHDTVIEALNAHLENNERYDVAYRYWHRDGEYRWQQSQGQAVFDGSGKPTRMIASFSDIQDQMVAFEKIRESEEKFRDLYESAPIGIFQTNSIGQTLAVNTAMAKILGCNSPEEAVHHYSDLSTELYVNPERRHEFLERLKQNHRVENYEYEAMTFDKRNVWLSMNARLIRKTDDTFIIEGFATDITKRKQAENALQKSVAWHQSILKTAMDGFWLVDLDGRLLEVNRTYSRMSGYHQDELLTMHIQDLENSEGAEDVARHIQAIMAKGEDRFESQQRRKNGEIFDVEVCVQYKDVDGGRLVCFIRDISERRRWESRLQQAQKMESIGNLAGGIAHDFNNLLFPIIGMSEMLVEDLPVGSPEQENAYEILKAGHRGAELVKQILAFSRQNEHNMSPVRLQFIIKEVLKLIRSSIPANIDIKQDLQSDCSLIMADSTQLHQIGMNLMTNAYHAVQELGGVIRVHVKEVIVNELVHGFRLPMGKYVKLSVSDNGSGISQENLTRIFEPYFTTKEKGKGTGLGLAVVYGIVKEHKGDINVISRIGKGTTVDVYFPIMKASKPMTTDAQNTSLRGGMENILLVDDEDAITRLVKQMLERLGYSVTVKSGSLAALEMFKKNPEAYDLVISDMSMPYMTGDRLAEELLALRPDLPIIICTGFSERFDRDDAKSAGIRGFLMKPIVKADIANEVRRVLDI